MGKIATLFDNDITRQIEEVIKVDQTSEDIIASEISEYVVTDAIKKHFVNVLEKYQSAPQNPSDNVAIWISGFFGSGKSSFAKVLGLAIEDRDILGTPAAKRFSARAGSANAARRRRIQNPGDPHFAATLPNKNAGTSRKQTATA